MAQKFTLPPLGGQEVCGQRTSVPGPVSHDNPPGLLAHSLTDTRNETVPQERLPHDRGWHPHRSVPRDR